jgi:hypothetical protein
MLSLAKTKSFYKDQRFESGILKSIGKLILVNDEIKDEANCSLPPL